ncbi:Asp23/Gls24 family envelope stress response protein [Corynebacterium bovis]|uniref:Asp23/Gls24 family envelope stress response protein n=1 Tax=Corynebacterium bovis TaxID=36808 RepID=A0A426Q4I1_9CORY|nr:Asp23/Gls24 family envelope stress response protein [Corynebacterium bovis]RRO89434.1 Asp23/Gls24 family envelope stress response protein [Corynebacterium bovis]RRO94412.1 Asp23/Gls24 family envelope stress response protein [Corynebacterium bovis]RRO95118.1 Asp23/Gls24 family envelope stress response protein [Corynebacterium bovis]RRQ01570.1 Asp23/Gls24 family envelope stress response protein [Corynebacterium bovis]RRQ02347.1 Asp23/Gls24 family envelope stress response protein [Corynebacter
MSESNDKNNDRNTTTPSNGSQKPATRNGSTPAGSGSEVSTTDGSDLFTDHGRTSVADVVVSKIAGMAAREVTGVHDLGGGTARVVGALRERIPGGRVNVQQGVSVEVGDRQAAVDISIVAEYGVAIHELAEAIRRNILISVERMTGLEVTEVNVTVHDVHLPEDDEDDDEQNEQQERSRVQ